MGLISDYYYERLWSDVAIATMIRKVWLIGDSHIRSIKSH